MDLLELGKKAKKELKQTSTRTCNITSLSMALEALGKGSESFKGNRDAVAAAARVYSDVLATAAGTVSDDLDGLRLPDFMQLAAIAEELGSAAPTEEAIRFAAVHTTTDAKGRQKVEGAWNSILSIGFLADLAKRFQVRADVVTFNLTSNDSADPKERKKHRSDDFSTLRGVGEKHRKKGEKQAGFTDAELAEMETSIPLEEYKERVGRPSARACAAEPRWSSA